MSSHTSRAGLPLVCQALNKLVNDPNSLLWEALDLEVTPEHQDEALDRESCALLQARGRRTRTLHVRFAEDLAVEWRDVFAALLPPLCPQLQSLVVDPEHFFRADDALFVLESCSTLRALGLASSPEGFPAIVASISKMTGLTSLDLRKSWEPARVDVREAVRPLQALTQLRNLRLSLGPSEFGLPACLPNRLLQLRSLTLTGCNLWLPASVRKLRSLTALRLNASHGWANLWPAASGLSSLRSLNVYVDGRAAVPSLQGAAFGTGLTGLTCCRRLGNPGPSQAAEGLLALPKLRSLEVRSTNLASRLEWGSLATLESLVCGGTGEQFEHVFDRLSGLNRLSRLKVFGGDITGDLVAELCHLPSLCRLDLYNTHMTALPEALASAQLTALNLDHNRLLSLDPAAYSVLKRMPALQSLHICVCNADEAPAKTLRSLAFLRAISKGLEACRACECHYEA